MKLVLMDVTECHCSTYTEVLPLSERAQGVEESKHKLKRLNSWWQILATTFSIVLQYSTDTIDGGFWVGHNTIISTKFARRIWIQSINSLLQNCRPVPPDRPPRHRPRSLYDYASTLKINYILNVGWWNESLPNNLGRRYCHRHATRGLVVNKHPPGF